MFRRSLQPILITLVVAAFPFVLLAASDRKNALYELAFALPYIILAVIAFLGLKLNQRKVFWISILFISTYTFLQSHTPPNFLNVPLSSRGQLLSFAIPLAMFGLLLIPYPTRSHFSALLEVAGTFFPGLAIILLSTNVNSVVWRLFEWQTSGVASALHLPGIGIMAALVFACSTFLAFDRYMRDFRVFVSLSLIPLFFVFEQASKQIQINDSFRLEAAVGFMSAGTLLAYAVFHLYWQKIYIDELTGVFNRRSLNEKLLALRKDFVIAMIDIDHFKRFNDTFGHDEGDNVLRFVASHLEKESHGRAFRYGGEEFCLVFEDDTLENVAKIVDTIRKKLSDKPFRIRASKKIRNLTSEKNRGEKNAGESVAVTVSAGVAAHGASVARPEDVVIAADGALYRAKGQGRNRVVASVEQEPVRKHQRV